jgi:tetratricopeptide (TPR) repeat protein
LTLLVGCVEYDMRLTSQAETTRRMAMQLGHESGHAEIEAWAHEMRSWFALTQGRYREVIESARQGRALAPNTSVSVQLAAQEAKAWARIGDRRHVELALEDGRDLLERLPYPDNVRNHFAIDPDKFDFYAMDCYRKTGDDNLATVYADEVIRKITAPDGTTLAPMRLGEARVTFAVAAARRGDLEESVQYGNAALDIPRQSGPSLIMVVQDLAAELRKRYPGDPAARPFLSRLATLTNTSAVDSGPAH